MSESREPSAILQLLLTIGLMIGGVLLTILISLLVLIPVYGFGHAIEVFGDLTEHVGALKTMQIVQGICLFIVPSYLLGRLISGHSFHWLKMDRPIASRTAVVVVLLILAAIPFINLLGYFNAKMVLPEALSGIEQFMRDAEDRAAEMTVLLVSGTSLVTLFVNLLMIAVIPAIGEEMLFRGVIQRILQKAFKNVHVAVFVAAFFFSAFHFQFFGFLPRFFIGLILGYLFVFSGSLWLSILAHFINNATVVVFYFLQNRHWVGDGIDTIGTAENWIMGIFSAGILLAIYFYIERNKVQLKLDELK